MRTFKILSALLLLCGWCPSALADFTVEQNGDIVQTGSWALPIGLFSTSSNIDLVGARITVGDPFSSPVAMDGFSVSGWTQNAISNGGYLTSASGPGAQSLGLSLHISGNVTDPVMFDVAGFSEGVFLGSYHGSWDGTGSFVYFSPGSWTPSANQFAHVPAPNSMVLAALGLCILGVVTRRLA
jgi:hypothetical protein